MGYFAWVSPRPLPDALDLRVMGWRLTTVAPDRRDCVWLLDAARSPRMIAHPPAPRTSLIAVGLGDSETRAKWLAWGAAEALGPDVGVRELHWRARRLVERGDRDTTAYHYGGLELRLDLRDAVAAGRRLRLNPREFALLWRLAAARGDAVARAALLRDVFDLGFDPGTNRLAVHVCRLRKKLAHAGLAHRLVTAAGDGGYALLGDGPVTDVADRPQRNPLDATQRLREQPMDALEEAAE